MIRETQRCKSVTLKCKFRDVMAQHIDKLQSQINNGSDNKSQVLLSDDVKIKPQSSTKQCPMGCGL